jgi:hypothetical protein
VVIGEHPIEGDQMVFEPIESFRVILDVRHPEPPFTSRHGFFGRESRVVLHSTIGAPSQCAPFEMAALGHRVLSSIFRRPSTSPTPYGLKLLQLPERPLLVAVEGAVVGQAGGDRGVEQALRVSIGHRSTARRSNMPMPPRLRARSMLA